jgi:hypothetical protein
MFEGRGSTAGMIKIGEVIRDRKQSRNELAYQQEGRIIVTRDGVAGLRNGGTYQPMIIRPHDSTPLWWLARRSLAEMYFCF